jgi:hypothetical protein
VTTSKSSRKLKTALHSLQVQNELLHHENDGLRNALTTERKYMKKTKPLELHQRKEFHGGAMFWSPRRVREARVCEEIKERDAASEKLQKTQNRGPRAAAMLYKKSHQEEAKVERQGLKEVMK